MANRSSIQTVIQNLRDAGCGPRCIEQFLALEQEAKTAEQIQLLTAHRQRLLDQIHRDERRMECLDYLVYQIQKQQQTV